MEKQANTKFFGLSITNDFIQAKSVWNKPIELPLNRFLYPLQDQSDHNILFLFIYDQLKFSI